MTNKIESVEEKPDSTNLPDHVTPPFETMEIFEEVEGILEDKSLHKCMVNNVTIVHIH